MKIVADDKIPFLRGALEPFAEMVYLPGKQIKNELIKDADALLIRTRTKCTEGLLNGTNVKFIGTATIGFDHIDVQYCEKNNITWVNAPGCNSSSVQQYITTALLKAAHDKHFNLKDKTIGIVGVGNVGSKVEKIARILGMNVLLNDPPRARSEGEDKFVSLNEILRNSDIITVHVPLNIVGDDITWHLFEETNFKKIRKGAIFINSSRGEVVDTPSIKKVLSSGKITAIIDVWENEPDIDRELMSAAFISTPHIAGYSTDGKANGTSMVLNSLSDFFNLPLKEWYPDNVPDPSYPEINIDAKERSSEDAIYEAVRHTYNIEEDDTRLRFAPSDFEKQRGDYPLRREFTSYKIRIKGGETDLKKKLKEMGFKI
jgi:erythronate-4-phosphate dehydrogenase